MKPPALWSPDPLVHWGVDWRDPLANRKVMETLLLFPQEALRSLMRMPGLGQGILPENLRLRRSLGLQPPALSARDAPRYRVALEGLGASVACRALLDLDALRAAFAALAAGREAPQGLEQALAVGMFLADLEA